MKQRLWNRFVVGHHPPMTAVPYRQGDNLHVAALMPVLAQYKVAAAFFGHNHSYQHYLRNGIHYVVTRGGGRPYDVDKPPEAITKKVERVENFVVVKIDGEKARFEAIRLNGELIDTVELGAK